MNTKFYNLKDLESTNPNIKYAMQRRILEIAKTDPQVLYQDFDYFVGLLDASNNIMIWTGLLVLGYLSKVDTKKKIDAVLPKIIAKLDAGKMITAGNATKSLTEIAKNRPDLADRIVKEITKIDQYKYDTKECSHIAIGHALANLKLIFDGLSEESTKSAIKFAEKQVNNPRSATAKRAQYLLKKAKRK